MFAIIENGRVYGYEKHNEYAPDYAAKLIRLNAKTEGEAEIEAPIGWVYDGETGRYGAPPVREPDLSADDGE